MRRKCIPAIDAHDGARPEAAHQQSLTARDDWLAKSRRLPTFLMQNCTENERDANRGKESAEKLKVK
jgi:hypothetical protein